MEPSPERDLVALLAEEFRERLRRGESPDVADYAARYPEHAGQIRELFPALVMMEKLKPAPVDLTGAYDAPPSAPKRLERLGDYRILRQVGHGGMGIVYEAEQESLGRRVALEVLPTQLLLDPRHQKRFQREARAAARLHHTNIVPVYGVGEQDQLLYYVMQFIHGRGLDEVLLELKRLRQPHDSPPHYPPGSTSPAPSRSPDVSAADVARSLLTGSVLAAPLPNSSSPNSSQPAPAADATVVNGSPEPAFKVGSSSGGRISNPSYTAQGALTDTGRHYWQSVARIGIQAAEALDYASSLGILHRDIKPSNLLLDTQGNVWVTDFGLAKASDDGEDLTHTGDIVGTLRYMAPERFEGRSDVRGDIYSLGLTLYELLVQQPAFGETDRNKLIHQVNHDEVPPPRRLNPAVPRDLETIVLKAIARDPAHRYQKARELAEDLQHFLEDKPIKARRVSIPERLWRWCRRNPAVACLTAGIAVLLLLAAVGSTLAAVYFGQLADRERSARTLVTEERDKARLARDEAELARKNEAQQRQAAEEARQVAEMNQRDAQLQKQQADAYFAKARGAVDDYLSRVSESQLLNVPGMQPLRRDLLASALTFYQDFLKNHSEDAGLKAALADAQRRVGLIYRDLGESEASKKALREALALYQELSHKDPRDVNLRLGLARCHYNLGLYPAAIREYEQLHKDDPVNTTYTLGLANALNDFAVSNRNSARKDLAAELDAHQRALALEATLVRNDPENAAYRSHLAGTLNNIGVLLAGQGRHEEARTMYVRAVEHLEVAVRREPNVLLYRRYLGIGSCNIGNEDRHLGRLDEALRRYQQSIAVWRRLVEENPAVPDLHSRLYGTYVVLARTQRQMNQGAEASKTLKLAREVIERHPRQSPTDLFNLACVLALSSQPPAQETTPPTSTDLAERRRQADEAMAALRWAVAAGYKDSKQLTAHVDLAPLRHRPDFRKLVAEVEEKVKSFAATPPAAETEAERKKQAAQAALRYRADLANSHYTIGLLQIDLNKTREAEESLARALELFEGLVKDDQALAGQHAVAALMVELARGQVDWKAERYAAAAQQWRRCLEKASRLKSDPEITPMVRQLAAGLDLVAKTYGRAGLWEETRAPLATAAQLDPSNHVHSYWQAAVLLQLGDREGYLSLCKDLLARFGNDQNLDTASQAGQACLFAPDSGADPAVLARLAEKSLKTTVSRSGRQVIKGITAYRAGKFDEAIQEIEQGLKASAVGHNRAGGNFVLAMAQHQLGKTEAARQALDQARKDLKTQFPGVEQGDFGLGLWHDWLSCQLFRREAETMIEGSTADFEPVVHLARGRMYVKLGQADRAKAEFEAGVKARPEDPATWDQRARVYAELGQDEQAEADLAKAIALDEKNVMSWIARGRFRAERGRHEQADADFARAAALTPDNLQPFLKAGWWAVGPYPNVLQTAFAAEKDPDPSRPVLGGSTAGTSPAELRWRQAISTGPYGAVRFDSLFDNRQTAFVYTLTYVSSPQERSATLLFSATGASVRIWVNGQMVYEATALPARSIFQLEPIPVTLRAGRNTLLVKVSKPPAVPGSSVFPIAFFCRIADGPMDRALALAQLGLWNEAGPLLTQEFQREEPTNHELWRWYALLQQASGDAEGYRRLSGHMLEKLARAVNSYQAYELLCVCNLAPEAGRDWAQLISRAEPYLRSAPTNPERLFEICLARYRAGQFEEAIKELQEAKNLKDQPKAWTVLAMAQHQLKKTDEARALLARADAWYEKALKDALSGPAFRLPWSGGWWEFAQFQILHREARTMIAEAPGEDKLFQAVQERARAELKKMDRTSAAYDHALLIEPKAARLWLARAWHHAARNEPAKAEADFAQALALKSDAQVWKERGRYYAQKKDWDKAADDFVEALSLVKEAADPWAHDRAGVDDELVQSDEVFSRVAALRKDDSQLWVARARHLGSRGQWPEAAAATARAVELNLEHPVSWYNLATLRLYLGQVEEYRRACAEMLTRFGKLDKINAHPVAKTCLLAPGGVGDRDLVQRLVEEALTGSETNVNYPWFLLTKALWEYRGGRFAETVAVLERCLSPNAPDLYRDATVYVVLAMARQQLGQKGEAQQALARAQALRDQQFPKFDKGAVDNHWGHWLRFEILRREAEELLKQEGQEAARKP